MLSERKVARLRSPGWPLWVRCLAVILLTAFFNPLTLFAQVTTSSISGTISDSTSAVVPGAGVVATQISTGTTTKVKANAEGFYVLTDLSPGIYRLRVEQPGFATYIQAGIVLQVDRPVTVNITLHVGSQTQAITISGAAPQVDVRNAVLSTEITGDMAQNLPLNGRNVLQLMTLAPDVSPSVPGGYYSYYAQGAIRPEATEVFESASGGRGNSTGFYLDGGIDEDPYDQVSNIFPNPDTIQEFSYETNNYSARYGGRGGGVVNAVTKGGTNQFHGSAFEFVRNGDMNARNFFASTNDGLKRNQYGFTFGGPLRKDKTFFFAAWQATKLRSAPTQNVAITATEAEREGDFSAISQQLVDPSTGVAFLNNQVPMTDFDPVALKVLAMIPAGAPGTGIAYYTTRTINNDNQWTGRLDQNISDKVRIYGRYLYDYLGVPSEPTPGNLLTAAASNRWRSENLTLNALYLFRPNLTSTLTATYNRVTIISAGPAGFPGWTQLGVNVPDLVTAGPKTSLAFNIGGYWGAFWDGIYRFPRAEYHFENNWSYVKGGHTLQFGGELKYNERSTGDQDYLSDGYFDFTAQQSGNNLLDFMLGKPDLYQQNEPYEYTLQRTVPALYVSDTWKVNKRLTLDLGVRWNPWIPLQETTGNKLATFSWPAYDAGIHSQRFPLAPPGLLYGGDPGVPDTIVSSSYHIFAPRIGFAYDVFGDGKTSIRGGVGIYHDEPYGNAFNGAAYGPPFIETATIPFPSGGLDNPYEGQVNPFAEPFNLRTSPFPTPFFEYVFDQSITYPTIQQWNFTVERQLTGTLMIRAAYQGSSSYHMFLALEDNPAVYVPGESSFADVQALRPLGAYFTNLVDGTTRGNSSYNALAISAEKRLSHGLSFQGGYRWAKSLDVNSQTDFDEDVPDPFNLRFNRGLSDYDISKQFILSYLWALPAPQSLGFIGREGLGGWHLNGILTLRGGFPFTVYSGEPYSYTGPESSLERADIIGNPYLPSNRPLGQKLAEWFNTQAFVYNAPGTFGDSPRNFLRGPAFSNLDFGLIRSFPIKKGPFAETQRIDFRAEFFNIFNHPNFHNPEEDFSQITDGPVFGTILGAYDPRILQFALKYIF